MNYLILLGSGLAVSVVFSFLWGTLCKGMELEDRRLEEHSEWGTPDETSEAH